MSFFRPLDPPEPPAPPARPRWAAPHTGELGGFVPERVELARTAEVVVLLGPMEAHPEGVRITLQVRTRQPHISPIGHGFPGEVGGARIGVAFADGRTTETGNRHWVDPGSVGDGPVLSFSGGGGGGGRWDQDLWLWPLPPPGPVTFVLLWEEVGIPETSVEIDAQVLLDAAARAEHLWEPLTPEEEQAAHRAHVARFAQMGGVTATTFGVSAPEPEPGADDEYL